MFRVKYQLPNFTEQDAIRLAHERYGLRVVARPLPSERDQNFYLKTETGREFVLKIANVAESREILDLQNRAMLHLVERAPSLSIPRVCKTTAGEFITTTTSREGATHFVRLLTYVPGKLFARVKPHSPELLHSLGRVLGTIDHALQDFSHPAARRELKWDLQHASWIGDYVQHIALPTRRAMVESFLTQYESSVVSMLRELRTSLIYNDANDYNVLVGDTDSPQLQVIGVIDFGDMVHTNTICELAIAAAYAMMGKADPLTAAAHIVSGYHEAFPLTKLELEVLFQLICIRLCLTVTNSAYQRVVEPDNEYLTISEKPAWALLEKLAAVSPQLAHYTFRHACRMPPCPKTHAVVQWLENNAEQIGSVIEPDLKTCDKVVFDLSAASPMLSNLAELADTEAFTKNLFARMKAAHVNAGIGKYNEARPFYTSEQFKMAGNDGPEWRTIHLGIDLFMEAGSPVFAPLDGVIYSARNNDALLDYGPT
ncbi:MAG: phosphotransferase, partial [bacterium]